MKVFLLDLNSYTHMSYGLLCLADALGKQGHAVVVGGRPKALANAARRPREVDFVVEQVKAASPDLIGLSAFSTTAFALESFLPRLKEQMPGTPIVIGGVHCLLERERALDGNSLADFCFLGEGEEAFPAFLSGLSKGGAGYRDCPGLIFRESGRVVCNTAPEPVQFDDYIPMRAFKRYTSRAIFDMDEACEAPLADSEHFYPLVQPTLSVLLSRGCPYRCTFCHMPCNPYNKMRYVSPEAFERQLAILLDEFPFRSLFIHDSAFDINKPWARRIARVIENTPRIVDWACQFKPDLVTDDFVGELVSARCRAASLYLENAVERIRNGELNKQIEQEELEHAYEIVEKHRIFVRVNCILGSPGESTEEIMENVEFLERHPPGQGRFLRLFVLPGTELHKKYPNRRFVENPEISDQQYATLRFILGLHYSPLAIQLRRSLSVATRSIMMVQDEPSSEQTLRSMQELALMIGLRVKPDDALPRRMTLLVAPCSGALDALLLPLNTHVVKFAKHPLAADPGSDTVEELRTVKHDCMVLASDRPSEGMLDAMVLLANRLGVPRVAVVSRRHGLIVEYDLFSKNLSQYRFCLDFSRAVSDALNREAPMSNETVDFQILRELGI